MAEYNLHDLRFIRFLLGVMLFPLRFAVFFVGWLAYWMEIISDYIVGTLGKTEYVRQGKCKRCGKCCRLLALILPKSLAKRNSIVRVIIIWHRLAMNFHYVGKEDGWLMYRCGYYKESCDGTGGCSIYPFRHRLCRFFPKQGLYGHPSLHEDCGFKFVRREVAKRLKLETNKFRDVLSNKLRNVERNKKTHE